MFTLKAHISAFSTDSNGFTSGAIDTTAADLIVVVGSYSAGSAMVLGDLTDSKSNTLRKVMRTVSSNGTHFEVIYYWWNVASVGSGHTFTLGTNGSFPALCVSAWGGSQTSSDPFDQENTGNVTFASTLQTGSVTPGSDNELVIAGIGHTQVNSAADTINSSFTVLDSIIDTSFGHGNPALAYQIQTTATTRNPTWTSTGGNDTLLASIATFKAAAGATVIPNKIVKTLQAVNRSYSY